MGIFFFLSLGFSFSCFFLSSVAATTTELAVLLLGSSLATAVLVGVSSSVWFGVGVWLVFISGLLVLFLFFCAVTGDGSVGPSLVQFICLGAVVSIMILSPLFLFKNNLEATVFMDRSFFMLIWMVGFLLCVMVVVVKATPSSAGAMREPSMLIFNDE